MDFKKEIEYLLAYACHSGEYDEKDAKQLLKEVVNFCWDKGYLGASGKVTMGKHQIKREFGLIDYSSVQRRLDGEELK